MRHEMMKTKVAYHKDTWELIIQFILTTESKCIHYKYLHLIKKVKNDSAISFDFSKAGH